MPLVDEMFADSLQYHILGEDPISDIYDWKYIVSYFHTKAYAASYITCCELGSIYANKRKEPIIYLLPLVSGLQYYIIIDSDVCEAINTIPWGVGGVIKSVAYTYSVPVTI